MTPVSPTPVHRHPELDSTNSEAMRRVAAGETGPCWIIADTQTGGRGRSGRAWTSPPGNLYASYLFTTPAPVLAAHQLSLVAGVAVFDAIVTLGLGRDAGLRLKWPNDILIGRAKTGGILVESSTVPGRRDLIAVIGIGLNIASHPDLAGRDLTHLRHHATDVPPAAAVLEVVDRSLQSTLALWDGARGFPAIRTAWLSRAGKLGEALSVHPGDGTQLSGTFAGLDAEGALLLELRGGEVRRCTYGDVSLDR